MLIWSQKYLILFRNLLIQLSVYILFYFNFTRAYTPRFIQKPATITPCCMDTLTPGTCRTLLHRDPEKFYNSCRQDPDFSFMQCCFSCHFSGESFIGVAPTGADLYKEDAVNLLLNMNSEHNHCFDRHGNSYCTAFLERRGRWAQKQLNCDHASLAFRICRKTCGYCSSYLSRATVKYNGEDARNMKKCQRLF